LKNIQTEHASVLSRSYTTVLPNTVWLKVYHMTYDHFRLFKISVKITLEKLCHLVESVYDGENKFPSAEKTSDTNPNIRTRICTRLFCNDEYSRVEIYDDSELHYILESCVQGGSSIICEAEDEYPEDVAAPMGHTSSRPELGPGEVIRPRTPDNLRKIRDALLSDAQISPRGLAAEIKTAAKKRKSNQNIITPLSQSQPSSSVSPFSDWPPDGEDVSESEQIPVKRLLHQVVAESKRDWENNIWKWAKDVQKIFAYNIRMIRLVFNLIDSTHEHKNFMEAMNFVKNSPLPLSTTRNMRNYVKIPTAQELSDWLIVMGFSVRLCKYSIDDRLRSTEVVEPETIIVKLTPVSIKYLLKSMLIVIKP